LRRLRRLRLRGRSNEHVPSILVAGGMSVIVRIEARRVNWSSCRSVFRVTLPFIEDGKWGERNVWLGNELSEVDLDEGVLSKDKHVRRQDIVKRKL
jgi:hypothetical protein